MDILTAVLFATDDNQWWLTPAIVASVVANFILLWKQFRESRKESRRDTLDEYDVLLRKMEKMGDRHETEIFTLQRVVAILSRRCADCDSDMERIFSHLRNFHGVATRLADGLEKLGGDPEPIPKMPAMPARKYPDAEFLSRTTAQFAAASKAADRSVMSAKTSAPDKEPEGENTSG